jgi:hypothetical protein
VLPRLLLYALGVWAILLLTRVVFPILATLGSWRRAWTLLRIAIVAAIFHQAAEWLLIYVFQLDDKEFWGGPLIWIFSFLVAIIADYFASMAWGHEGDPHQHDPGGADGGGAVDHDVNTTRPMDPQT